ncbi:hypothetical protein Lser_V15G42258 [Lactuca serriola]
MQRMLLLVLLFYICCDIEHDVIRPRTFPMFWFGGVTLGLKTGSLDQRNLFEKRVLYSIVYNKRLDFAQLFLDQMIDSIIANKKPLHVPYPRWLGMILSQDEGYVKNHGIFIPIPAFSLKMINVVPSQGDFPITMRMQKWIEKPCVVESLDSEEDDENDDDT